MWNTCESLSYFTLISVENALRSSSKYHEAINGEGSGNTYTIDCLTPSRFSKMYTMYEKELVQGGRTDRHPSSRMVVGALLQIHYNPLQSRKIRRKGKDICNLPLRPHDGNGARTFRVYLRARDNRFPRKACSWRRRWSFLINGKWSISWCWWGAQQ